MSLNEKPEHAVVKFLESRRAKIFSTTGGWRPGNGVFSHGYSMLEELVGEKSYFQILILNATGRLVQREVADWIEACFACMSWPDPRIWCNQVGAFAGSARASASCAATLGCLTSESTIYGAYTSLEGASFIQQALSRYKSGDSIDAIVNSALAKRKGKPVIMGYFRPIAKGDERIEALERVGKSLGFEVGEHLSLAYEIEKYMLARFDEGLNLNGYATAFLSDQEFTGQEIYQTFTLCVNAGVIACYIDAKSQPRDAFLPLRCDDIDYRGPQKRTVPEA